MLPDFTYVRASSVKEALSHLTAAKTMVMAGGTDLLGCLRDEVFEARHLVGINHIDALRGIRQTQDGSLEIGALSTVSQVAEHVVVKTLFTALAQAASEVASPQLRNQGTMGGNLCQKPRCWYYRGQFNCLRKGGQVCYAVGGENQYHCILGGDPCYIVHPSDTAAALTALDAVVHIAGPAGTRAVPVEQFYVRPSQDPQKETVLRSDEMVTHIVLPAAKEGLRSSYRKVRARRAWDFALAGVALAIRFTSQRVTGARVVLSGAAPVPWRCREAEDVLVGKAINADLAKKAARATVAKAQPMTKNVYKVLLFRNVVEEELMARFH